MAETQIINSIFAQRDSRLSGKYIKTDEVLGEGAGGSVYVVMDVNTKNEYALKQFGYHEYSLSIQTINEIEILRILRGVPYIIQLLDIVVIDGPKPLIGMIMPKLKYNLQELIIDKKLTPDQVLSIMQKLLWVVATLQENRIMHRDIKHDNIMLDADMNPYLCDFGIAKTDFVINTEFDNTGGVGTCYFRAPEVVADYEGHTSDSEDDSVIFSEYGLKADLWSLGVVIFELFHGNYDTEDKEHDVFEKLIAFIDTFDDGPSKTIISAFLRMDPDERVDPKNFINFHLFPNKIQTPLPKLTSAFIVDEVSKTKDSAISVYYKRFACENLYVTRMTKYYFDHMKGTIPLLHCFLYAYKQFEPEVEEEDTLIKTREPSLNIEKYYLDELKLIGR